jgi:signal transduction histidine kinase/CheY-like chemotaxis protein
LGLIAYCTLSIAGSGGSLLFAAIVVPLGAFSAGVFCARRTAVTLLGAFAIAVSLAMFASDAEANPLGRRYLVASFVIATPTLAVTLLYRGLYERVLEDAARSAAAAREASESQAALSARLRESERLASLGRMAGGIAHDFNNILTAIGGNAELLGLSARVGPEEREQTAHIVGAVDRAAELVKQLLDYTGRGRRQLRQFRLSHLVEESARILRAGIARDVALEVTVLRDALLEADWEQVNQLAVELAENAESAYGGKPGTVAIEIDRVDQTSPDVLIPPEGLPLGDYAVLRVGDDGCGIAGEALPRIFDPFFAGFSGRRGLGLAAVLGIVRGHAGGIAVESSVGAGTSITIYLPCRAATTSSAREAAQEASRTRHPMRELRLLVVDDEEAVRKVVAQHLIDEGATVHVASDGESALSAIPRIGRVDAALIDVSMPRMGGIPLLEALRASGRTFPVILMTGHADVDIARFGAEANVTVVLKPFRLAELAAALERARTMQAAASEAQR